MISAVFFDLDGTLVDTAPDLAYALNLMRVTRGFPPLPLSATRHVTSSGARGLLRAGFDIGPGDPNYGALRSEFLERYEENICRESRLFRGALELLDAIESRGLRWGVVTNKAERLARLLFDRLGMTARISCLVGGDTTPNLKPHPDSLLAACRAVGESPRRCVYVGDDLRDVVAAHAAGMKALAATWGYLNGEDPATWNADGLVDCPSQVERYL